MSFSGKGKINEECMSKQALQSPSSTVGFAKIFAKVSFHMTIGDTLSVLKSTAGRAVKQDRFVKWPKDSSAFLQKRKVLHQGGVSQEWCLHIRPCPETYYVSRARL